MEFFLAYGPAWLDIYMAMDTRGPWIHGAHWILGFGQRSGSGSYGHCSWTGPSAGFTVAGGCEGYRAVCCSIWPHFEFILNQVKADSTSLIVPCRCH